MIDSGNPFSTRHTRPGALPYRFPGAATAEQLVERLACRRWWGQILGPHGAGKTTLLHSLLPTLLKAERDIQLFTLHGGQRHLGATREAIDSWDARTQVIVDGYEQLSWLARVRLKSHCRRQSAGLLVTTHRDLGLPTLLLVQPNLATVCHLVADLTRDTVTPIDNEDVRRCFDQQQGNVREVFFALYDLYEQRRG